MLAQAFRLSLRSCDLSAALLVLGGHYVSWFMVALDLLWWLLWIGRLLWYFGASICLEFWMPVVVYFHLFYSTFQIGWELWKTFLHWIIELVCRLRSSCLLFDLIAICLFLEIILYSYVYRAFCSLLAIFSRSGSPHKNLVYPLISYWCIFSNIHIFLCFHIFYAEFNYYLP